jgi:iron complex outermembrane receptor protein
MRKAKVVFIILMELSVSSPLFAAVQNDELSLDDELKFLAAERHVVVTASKQAEHVSKTVATTTVISKNDIAQMGARTLLDILRIVPGLGVTQSSLGVAQIEVRGITSLASEKVLFMLNGHPLDHNLQNAGSTWSYDDMPVDNIKRVEVVRGPGSALYGANAFLGVINIITMNAKDYNGEVQASTAWGSFDTQQYRAAWGKQFENTAEAAMNFNYTDTNGINSIIAKDALSNGPLASQSLAPGNSNLNAGRYDLEWNLGYKDFKLDGRFISKTEGTFVGGGSILNNQPNAQNYDDYFLRLSRVWLVTDKLSINTQVYHDYFSFDNTLRSNTKVNGVPTLTYTRNALVDTRNGGEIQGDYQLTETQKIITGFSYSEDSQGSLISQVGLTPNQLYSAPLFGKDNMFRSRWGIYTQDTWDPLPNLRISVGGRYDRYNDFGGTFNPRMGFNWEFIKNYSVKSSYGTAYRAPSFGEMGLINSPFLRGNPTLTPELAQTFETGLIGHPIDGLMAQATYYHTKITEVITTQNSVYLNSGTQLSEGVELEGRYDFTDILPGSYIGSNAVYQHTIQNNDQLPNVPQARANLFINWAYNRQWSVYGNALIKGETMRSTAISPTTGVLLDTRPNVPAYALYNLSLLGKQFYSKNLDVSFSIYNLMNSIVYDPSPSTLVPGDFQEAGRSFFGRISLRY